MGAGVYIDRQRLFQIVEGLADLIRKNEEQKAELGRLKRLIADSFDTPTPQDRGNVSSDAVQAFRNSQDLLKNRKPP